MLYEACVLYFYFFHLKKLHKKFLKCSVFYRKSFFHSRNTESFNLDINEKLECIRESFKEDPVLASIEKYATHSSIKNINSRMSGINSNFSFKFY